MPKPISRTDLMSKRVHVALPIRVTYSDRGPRTGLEVACTYDIHSRGARIAGLRGVQRVGELITVERGRNKALCRVTWIGDPNSDLRGQFGIECVEEDKMLWEAELAEIVEVYEPIQPDRRSGRTRTARTPSENRRLKPRFAAQGQADLMQIPNSVQKAARVEDLSERGCLIYTDGLLLPGTDLKIVLNITNCDVTVKGQVRHGSTGSGMGIEFREIRKGDRPLLNYLLRKLAAETVPCDLWRVEVVAPA